MDFSKAVSKGQLHEQLHQWYKELGPIYKVNVVNRNMVVVTDPTSIESVIRRAMESGGRPPLVELVEVFNKEHHLPPSIATHNYEAWKRYRPLTNLLLQPQHIHPLIPRISLVAKEWTQKLKEMATVQPDHSYVLPQLRSCLNLFTLEAIVAVIQGKRLGLTTPGTHVSQEILDFTSNVENVVRFTSASMSTFPLFKYFKTPLYKQFEKVCLSAFEYCKKIRNQHSLQEIQDGTVHLADVYTALGVKNGLSEAELLSVDLGITFAAMDTTSAAITIALYELALSPSLQEELYQEICSVMAIDSSSWTELPSIDNFQLKKMHLLKNFVKDVMRKSPAIPLNSRVLFEDVEIQGYHIPKNTDIMLFNYGVNRDEKYFENPLQINPKRFDVEDNKMNEYTMLPFGLGERACPGKRIAMAEIHLLVAHVVYQFRLQTRAKDYELAGPGLVSPLISKENQIHFVTRR